MTTTYAARFRALGRRHFVTFGSSDDGWNRGRAELELQNVLADVRRGRWQPPAPVEEKPREEPTFHEYSSAWVARRRREVEARTVEHWEWALSCHLLPQFKDSRLSEITSRAVRLYRTAKTAEANPLSAGSINKTLMVLSQILDDAIEDELIATNPARGRKSRLRASKPRRTWLAVDEVRALLDAAPKHRALLSTMILSGLRVGELCNLRWRDLNLAAGRLRVEESKTDAGERFVDLSPLLLDELKLHKAKASHMGPDDYVFPTARGTKRDRANVRTRVLAKAIEKANEQLAKEGRAPLQPGVTNHTCRRTFASLLYEAGASPAYVMAQMGHASSALALEVYAKVMERKRDTGERMDALIRGADWAQTGTNGSAVVAAPVAVAAAASQEMAS
ncbi:MAG: tyrosine-type recombinase/integrase [Gaiellaceae bacterium]